MIESLIAKFTALMGQYEILFSLIGASMFGVVLFGIRNLWTTLKHMLDYNLVCRVSIDSNDDSYLIVNKWLAKQPFMQKVRRLHLHRVSYDNSASDLVTSFAEGFHFFFHKRRPFFVSISAESQHATTRSGKFYQITLMTLGRSTEPIKQLIRDASDEMRNPDTVDVYFWQSSYWNYVRGVTKRSVSNIYLPEGVTSGLLDGFKFFFSDEGVEYYESKGLPRRRGYLLYGPPGTGKSSLVLALASELKKPIYYLNLSSVESDADLVEALTEAKPGSILLIEDVDAVKVSNSRTKKKGDMDTKDDKDALGGNKFSSISLSGFLNCLDGVISPGNRILVLTSNHPEKLDDALIRPGRVDEKVKIGHMSAQNIVDMCKRLPDEPIVIDAADVEGCNVTGAQLQNEILKGTTADEIVRFVNATKEQKDA